VVRIIAVDPAGIASELGLEPGDSLLAINGQPLRDMLDFQLCAADEEVLLEVRKQDGELWDLEVEKDADDLMGLEVEHPEPTQCGNNCLFCFVHQLPRGMRRTLYVKDEDYRFSYLYGAYVTLSNLQAGDLERIVEQRLSPLYVSVHATDGQLRSHLLGREAPPILELLRRLTGAGIVVHTQVVLCPGINDGADLARTIEDLSELHPGVATLAVVPVGLTGYRQRLPQLRTPTPAEARQTLELVHARQRRFLSEHGTRFVFAADELYLRAGEPIPELSAYEQLAQIENGIGLIARFRAEAEEALADAVPLPPVEVSTFTGESASRELAAFTEALAARTGATIHLHTVRNDFFGGQVTVTGLLTGSDVLRELKGKPLGSALLVPEVVLKEGEELFLDDLSLQDLERELGVAVRAVECSPWGLLEGIEALAEA
jgi:putative radical SAM enzyme (TIGR03279 family)